VTATLTSRPSVDASKRADADGPVIVAPRRRTWPVWADAVVVGVLTAVIGSLFVWVPSLWFDEAATVVAAERSWAALGRMLGTVDIVHATYYAFMHLWFDVFGYSPVSLRMPSVLATGVTAGLTVTLGRVLVGRRTGIVAGLLFAILPRVTWMAIEGRSFAISTLICVAATLVFVIAWRRTVAGKSSWRWWIAYTVLAVLSCAVFLYAAFIVLSHGISAVLGLVRLRRQGVRVPRVKKVAARWVLAGAIATLGCIPIALMSSKQSQQVSWIPKPSADTVGSVETTQWFTGNPAFAILAWVLVVLSITVMLARPSLAHTSTLLVLTPLLVVPTASLIAISYFHSPLYSPRYLTMGTPFIAVLMAVGLAAVPWRPVIAAVLLGAAAISVPTFLEQRQPEAKDNSAWNQVADLIASQRAAEPAGTRGAVIYGPVRRHPAAKSRIIADTYPAAFVGLDDITLDKNINQVDGLWETQHKVLTVIDKTQDDDVVWLVTSNKQDWRPSITADLAAQGFHLAQQWHFSKTNVVKYER
jgi:mannosyltransferase